MIISNQVGFWTPEFQRQISAAAESHRTPIGQLILTNTALKFSDLAKALDEYHADDSGPVVVAFPSKTSLHTERTPAIESLLLVEFLNVIHDSKLERIEGCLDSLKSCILASDSETTWGDLVHPLISEIRLIKEGARFVRAELIENIFQTMESASAKISWSYATSHSAESVALLETCRSTLILVRGIRATLTLTGLEKNYWDDPANKRDYEDTMESLQTKINAIGGDSILNGAA